MILSFMLFVCLAVVKLETKDNGQFKHVQIENKMYVTV
jgi:hypothetical protein